MGAFARLKGDDGDDLVVNVDLVVSMSVVPATIWNRPATVTEGTLINMSNGVDYTVPMKMDDVLVAFNDAKLDEEREIMDVIKGDDQPPKIEEYSPMPDLVSWVMRQIDWSRTNIGVGRRTIGITKHILSEVEEIRKNPEDVMEWVDGAILSFDGAWRCLAYDEAGNETGLSDREVAEGVVNSFFRKQRVNINRTWPKTTSEDEPSMHVKDAVTVIPATDTKAVANFLFGTTNHHLTMCKCGKRELYIDASFTDNKNVVHSVNECIGVIIHG